MLRRRQPPTSTPTEASPLVLWIAVALLVLLVAVGLLFWRLGLLDFGESASDAQVLAAVLGLLGALFAASLTFIGVLLKHSVDLRTHRLSQETEHRLKLETSIRAVELLTEDGKPAGKPRQAGALFVLASLDQLDFALALLGEIWPRDEVSPGAATWVLEHAFASADADLQVDASGVAVTNAPRLAVGALFEFPDAAWTADLHVIARENLLLTLLRLLASRPYEEWHPTAINDFIVRLDRIRKNEPEGHIRQGAVLALDAVLARAPFGAGDTVYGIDGLVDVTVLRGEVADAVDPFTAVLSEAAELTALMREQWLTDEEPAE